MKPARAAARQSGETLADLSVTWGEGEEETRRASGAVLAGLIKLAEDVLCGRIDQADHIKNALSDTAYRRRGIGWGAFILAALLGLAYVWLR
jgi:hypothetical protein